MLPSLCADPLLFFLSSVSQSIFPFVSLSLSLLQNSLTKTTTKNKKQNNSIKLLDCFIPLSVRWCSAVSPLTSLSLHLCRYPFIFLCWRRALILLTLEPTPHFENSVRSLFFSHSFHLSFFPSSQCSEGFVFFSWSLPFCFNSINPSFCRVSEKDLAVQLETKALRQLLEVLKEGKGLEA